MDRPAEFVEASSNTDDLRERTLFVEPQGDLERVLAEIWQQALKLDRVGRNDNFFELGGNSLIGMEVTEILADRLAIELPVVVLFQYPTIQEIAEAIATEQADGPMG